MYTKDDLGELIRIISCDTSASSHVIDKLVYTFIDRNIHQVHYLLAHPAISAEALKWLSMAGYTEDGYMREVTKNRNTTTETLLTLMEYPNVQVRANIVSHRNCTLQMKKVLMGDPEAEVRMEVLNTQNLSYQMLLKLTRDENMAIATRAYLKIKNFKQFKEQVKDWPEEWVWEFLGNNFNRKKRY